MGGQAEILSVIEQIYDAGAGTVSWEGAMHGICDLLGSAEMIIYEFDPVTGETPYMTVTSGLRDIMAEYSAHYVRVDPRVRHAAENPQLTLLCDYHHITESEMDGSEHYSWLDRLAGLRYYMGWRIHLGSGMQWAAAVQRTPRQGHAQRQHIDLFETIAPHIVRASGLWRQLASLDGQRAGLADAFDRLQHGVLLVNESGAVQYANRAAQAIALTGDGVDFSGSGFRVAMARESAMLQKALSRIFGTGGQARGGGCLTTVSRPSGKRPYILKFFPLSDAIEQFGIPGPLAMVTISDPEAQPADRSPALQELFCLTPAEVRLAMELATGDSLDVIARRIGVARETARSTLKQIFSKTDTHRQAELVRLLFKVPAD
jgi:DNA-binding CsgD family transcriptional regulator